MEKAGWGKVCNNTTTGTASFRTASSPDRRSTVNVKGTKVINATSFVINMLKKKHSNTRISASAITLWVCCNNILATLRNMPSFCNPAITVIRQNKIASVRKSIYPIYSVSVGTYKHAFGHAGYTLLTAVGLAGFCMSFARIDEILRPR